MFQEDIYPNCASVKPALSADEWAAGNNKDPVTMSLDPDERKDDDMDDDGVTFKKKKTYDEVVAENMELKKLVKKLQDELDELKSAGKDEEEQKEESNNNNEKDVSMDVDGGDADNGGDEQ